MGSINIKSRVEIDINKINADLLKFANIYCSTAAMEAADLIDKFAFKEMIGYYTEYEPRLYERTYDMAMLSHKRHYKQLNNFYEGGIDIHSKNTNHIDRRIKEEDIYEMVWVEGIHGYEKISYNDINYFRPIQGTPYRIDKIKNKAYSAKIIQVLQDKAMNKAKRQRYSILRFK